MEEYDFDILKTNAFSDVLWSLKSYNPKRYKYSVERSPQEIKRHVLESRRVSHIIEETAKEQGKTIAEIKDQAKSILDEMGHNYNLKTLRFMAFVMKKILSTLLRKVLVNKKGLERLREASEHTPVVLMPCHRSYLDFLLVSFICFHVDLPLPFVAAAQDFMNMRVVRRLFRHSGAFFMRRSFVNDKLYWVIFAEYIQNQLRKGDKPLEFFLEGTRSRTGKFLHPKLGLLSMVVDLYANAGVPNIMLCPISISYDKVVEESLFAYELLGIPKPKESLRALINSRSVLSEDYGNIYVNFGELVPLSSCIEGKLDRMDTAATPRHLLLYLTEDEKEVVRQTAYNIIAKLQSTMVVTSSVTVAAIMLQNPQGLMFDDVVTKFDWLQDLFRMLKIPSAPSDFPETKDIIKDSIKLQKSSLEVDLDGFVRIKEPQTPESDQHGSAIAHASRKQHHVISSVKDVLDEAAIHLQLAYKRNTLLPYFFGIGMVSMATKKQHSEVKQIGILTEDFNFLAALLIQEVSGLIESLPKIFHVTLETLQADNILAYSSHDCFVVHQDACLEFAAGLWIPILTAYWVVAEYLLKTCSSSNEDKSVGDVQRGAQHLAGEYVLSGKIRFFEVLSLELLKNAIGALKDIKVISVLKRPNAKIVTVPDRNLLRMIHKRIGEFLHISQDSKFIAPPLSKL